MKKFLTLNLLIALCNPLLQAMSDFNEFFSKTRKDTLVQKHRDKKMKSADGLDELFSDFTEHGRAKEYRKKKMRAAYAADWKTLRQISAQIQEKRLLEASQKHDWPLVKTIITKNKTVDPNVHDRYGFPLLYAAQAGNIDAMSFLLTHGADANQTYHEPRQSIGLMKCFTYYNVWQDRKTALFDAVCAENIEAIKLLLHHKADVKKENSAGQNALFIALDNSCYTEETFTIVSILVTAGAPVNVQEDIVIINKCNGEKKYGGQTPLIKASQRCFSMVKMLIDLGACNTKAQDVHGKTAHDYAREARRYNVVELLTKTEQETNSEFPQPNVHHLTDIMFPMLPYM